MPGDYDDSIGEKLTLEQKVFAIELASIPDDPLEAAMKAHGGDRARAVDVYMDWYNNKAIKAFSDQHLKVTGKVEDNTPTKEEIIKDIYKITQGRHTSDRDKINAYKIICDMEGHIQTGSQTNVQVNTNVQKNVMVMESHGTKKDWQKSLEQQQAALMDSSRDPDAQETIDEYKEAKEV